MQSDWQQRRQGNTDPDDLLAQKRAAGYFDVFLCHNSEDKTAVKKIGAELKKSGILSWLDEWELRPGLPWLPLVEKQIERIQSAAVLVGIKGIGPWQEQELYALLGEFAKRHCPVIPVLLPDAPSEPPLPIFLRGMTWVDFRKADPDPMQQLIWGITGQRGMLPCDAPGETEEAPSQGSLPVVTAERFRPVRKSAHEVGKERRGALIGLLPGDWLVQISQAKMGGLDYLKFEFFPNGWCSWRRIRWLTDEHDHPWQHTDASWEIREYSTLVFEDEPDSPLPQLCSPPVAVEFYEISQDLMLGFDKRGHQWIWHRMSKAQP